MAAFTENLQKLQNPIQLEASIQAPVEQVWSLWTNPEHIKLWNSASEDWHTTKAENDLRVGGKFMSRMEAKDKSAGFDLEGIYDSVIPNEFIAYHLMDNRKVIVSFQQEGQSVLIKQAFEAENQNPREMQQMGWQSILHSFKSYAEKTKE